MNKLVERNQQQQQSTALSTETSPSNPFTAYGEAVTHRNIVGELLKFSKGDWLVGQDNEEVKVGTQFVANMHELLVGWIRWQDNKPTDHIMGKVVDSYQPPRRSELGDTDSHEWEVDDRGDPRDPWQLSNYLLMKGMVDGELYTFTTGSKGGRDAIGDLSKDYGKVMAQHGDEFPVVAISVRSYEHPNKSYGRIKTPEFKIVGWVGRDTFAVDLGENGDPEHEPDSDACSEAGPMPVPVPDPAPKPQRAHAQCVGASSLWSIASDAGHKVGQGGFVPIPAHNPAMQFPHRKSQEMSCHYQIVTKMPILHQL